MPTAQSGYTPRHAANGGRHRSGESATRNERVGGYTPTHGKGEASTRKRVKSSLRDVQSRGKNPAKSTSLLRSIWALGAGK